MLTRVMIAVLVLFAGLGTWMAWSYQQPSVSAEPFEAAKWSAGAGLAEGIGDPGCVRGAMALDLLQRKRLPGMTAGEVHALLGTPARYGPEWTYALGQCSGYGWQHSGLVVRFSPADGVIAASFQHAP